MSGARTVQERRRQVLRVVVEEYVSTATPVPSEEVAGRVRPPVSSATIRNDVAVLAEEGYVQRPHHSAGAVPSTKGYRFYVDTLEVRPLSPAERAQVFRHLASVGHDIEAWVRLATALLADAVSNVALVTLPVSRTPRVKHLELVYLQELLALLVLVLEEARIRRLLLSLAEPVTPADLEKVSNKMTSLLAGKGSREIESDVQEELTPLEALVRDKVVEVLREEEAWQTVEHQVAGLRHLLAQPEFSAVERATEVVEALERQALLRYALSQAPEGTGVRVVIGEENPEAPLQDLTFIVCRYGIPGEASGVVSVVGPTRLTYPRAIAYSSLFASVLTHLLFPLTSSDRGVGV